MKEEEPYTEYELKEVPRKKNCNHDKATEIEKDVFACPECGAGWWTPRNDDGTKV